MYWCPPFRLKDEYVWTVFLSILLLGCVLKKRLDKTAEKQREKEWLSVPAAFLRETRKVGMKKLSPSE